MSDNKHMPPVRTIWAYAYQILPPQPEDRLDAIRTVLDQANSDARRGARTWTGQVVLEERVTHILVVSDSPAQNHEVNRKLEATLQELNAGFSITVPIAVADDAVIVPDGVAAESDIADV
jgi:hypothetical protein